MDRIFRIGDFPNAFAQQGWQCPICGRVYSPATAMCFYCGNYKIITTTDVKIGDGNTIYTFGVWQPPKSKEDNNERYRTNK